MATTTDPNAWRQRCQPLRDVPPELETDGLDDRLILGGPEAEQARTERQAKLDAYRARVGQREQA